MVISKTTTIITTTMMMMTMIGIQTFMLDWVILTECL